MGMDLYVEDNTILFNISNHNNFMRQGPQNHPAKKMRLWLPQALTALLLALRLL